MVCYDDIPVSRMIFCSAHELPTDPTSPTEILKKEPSSSLDIDLNADQLPTSATAMETRESEANVATNLEDGAYGQSDELEYTEVKAEVAPTDSDDDIMVVIKQDFATCIYTFLFR